MLIWIAAVGAITVALSLQPRQATQDVEAGLVFGGEMQVDDLHRIELARDGASWTFARTDDGWWQVAPFRHPMRAPLLLGLPQVMLGLAAEDRLATSDEAIPSAATIGLVPPVAEIRLEDHEGNVALMHLGRRGMGGRGWAAVPDEEGEVTEILIVDAALHALLEREPPETWRDLRMFPGVSVDATSISRTVSGETLMLARTGRRWSITAPLPTRADDDAVARHLADIASVRGEAVLLDEPADLSAFGLSPPVARVAVESAAGTAVARIGGRVGGASQARYAMVEGVPSILRIGAADVGRLLGDPAVLVDHTGTGVSPPDVRGVRIRQGDRELLLERQLDVWSSPTLGVATEGTVEHLLELLTTTRAERVSLHEAYPSEHEVAVITLLGRSGGPLDTVRLLIEPGVDGAPERWAMENGDRVFRVLPEDTHFPHQPADFGLSGTP